VVKILANEKEKIPDHIFKYVEKELYSYRLYQATVKELQRDLEELLERYPQFRTDKIVPRNEVGDPVGLAAIRALFVEEKIRWNMERIRKIETGLEVLKPEERELVEKKYFSEVSYTNEEIMLQLRLSHNSFYRKRNEIINKFAMVFNVI